MPTVRSLSQIKSNLLQPSLTSHFEVEIYPPPGLTNRYFTDNGVDPSLLTRDKLNMLCSETVLPGSSIATLELNNDHHGATIRHAYRRLYDDRIDLTFYVSADDYLPIRYFETWIKYIVGENINSSTDSSIPGSRNSNYSYRINYPDLYVSKGANNEGGLKITKFERTSTRGGQSYFGRTLQYQFVDIFPISISSMPVSYDASSLLKCNVSMTYLRYVMLPASASPLTEPTNNSSLTPQQQAALNQIAFDPNVWRADLGINYDNLTTTGGVTFDAASSSGNTINNNVTFNQNLNLI